MKQVNIFLLLVLVLVACSPQVKIESTSTQTQALIPSPTSTFTPTITLTPNPTLTATLTSTPCPLEGTPFVTGDIEIFFDSGVPQKECNLFALYIGKFDLWMQENGYKTGSIRVNVFSDNQRVTDFEYEWAREHGCNPDSKEAILTLWNQPVGTGAQSTYGASFYQVFMGDWERVDLNEKLVGVIGESVLVSQLNYAGSCQRGWLIPDWFREGQAQYLARQMEAHWGIEPADWTDWRNSNPDCQTIPLAQTQAGRPCVYLEGEKAFLLLAQQYGEKSFQVFELIGKGKSFNTAFYEVYGTSILDFYKAYDEFRSTEYTLPLMTMTPTP